MRRALSRFGWVALALSAACVEEASSPPCTTTGACLAGFECNASNVCVECPDGRCGPRTEQEIGPGGGLVCGPDGVCIEFPEGALDARVTITIRRPEPQPSIGQPLDKVSMIYEVSPTDLPVMDPPAVVRVPVMGVSLDEVEMLRLDGATLVGLAGTPANGRVQGRTDRLGSFVVARKGASPPVDGGVVDAEVDGGAGMDAAVDGGVGMDAAVDGGVGMDAAVDGGVGMDAADGGVIGIDVEPVFPDAAPVLPDAAPVFPDAAPVFPDAAPVFPDAAPVFPDAAPVFPDADPVFPDADPVFPDADPVFPDADPVFPDAAPVFPDAAPVFPDADPPDADLDAGVDPPDV